MAKDEMKRSDEEHAKRMYERIDTAKAKRMDYRYKVKREQKKRKSRIREKEWERTAKAWLSISLRADIEMQRPVGAVLSALPMRILDLS